METVSQSQGCRVGAAAGLAKATKLAPWKQCHRAVATGHEAKEAESQSHGAGEPQEERP